MDWQVVSKEACRHVCIAISALAWRALRQQERKETVDDGNFGSEMRWHKSKIVVLSSLMVPDFEPISFFQTNLWLDYDPQNLTHHSIYVCMKNRTLYASNHRNRPIFLEYVIPSEYSVRIHLNSHRIKLWKNKLFVGELFVGTAQMYERDNQLHRHNPDVVSTFTACRISASKILFNFP